MLRLTTVIGCLFLFVFQSAAQNTPPLERLLESSPLERLLEPSPLERLLEPSPLERLLEAELSRFPARAGIYVKHLETGEEAGVRADEAFNSASVIKITILAMALEWVDEGRLDLDERVEVTPSDFRGGSGIFRRHDPGLNPTIRDVLTQMIATSDNSATDMMISRLGGVGAVNVWIEAAGYLNTRLVQTIYEIFRSIYEPLGPEYEALTPEELYSIQSNDPFFTESRRELMDKFRSDSRGRQLGMEWRQAYRNNPEGWLGVMTPAETGRILEDIQQGRLASESSTAEMLRMLRRQLSGARRLPHYIDVPVGHKTGDLSDVANDVGIIYSRSGPIVVAIFTSEIEGPYGELEDRIGRVAQRIVDYFGGR